MKDRLLGVIPGAVTSFLLSFCAVGCLATGFHMTVDLGRLAIWCAVACVAGCASSALKVGLIPWCLVAVQGGWLWRMGQLEAAAESLLYKISVIFHGAYSWGIVRWSGRVAEELEGTLFLALGALGILIALLTAGPMCRGRSPVLPALGVTVVLGCCFVVTDTVPNAFLLGGVVLGLVLLLLPCAVRKRSQKEGNRLTWLIMLPAALAVLVLLGCVPQQTYNGQKNADKLTQLLFEDTPIESILSVNAPELVQTANGSRVDLTTVGIRLDSQVEVMQVRAPDYPGVMYLRGQALDSYDGRSWYASGEKSVLPWPKSNTLVWAGTVRINTRYAHRLLYQPYYANASSYDTLVDGLRNTEKLTDYSFQCYRGPQGTGEGYYQTLWAYSRMESVSVPGDPCLQLPDSTRAWAEKVLRELETENMGVAQQLYTIEEYVRSSATYDKMTARMPGKEKDFARWFLEDSDTGYCVHFASLATVLLRSAGIPARYVTGYMTTVDDVGFASVRAADAHAWVEFYLPGGWFVMEATPAAPVEEETTAPVEQTLPTEENVTQPQQQETKPAPGDKTPQDKTQARDSGWVLMVLWWLLGIGAAVALVYGQYRLRLHLRRKKLEKGGVNERALAIWEQVVYLRKLLRSSPGGLPYELAQKARFSQHTLTDQELGRLQDSLDTAVAEIKERPWYLRWILRIVFAAY